MKLLFLFLSFSLFACEKKNPELGSLMQKQLAEWKFNTEVISIEKNNVLEISVFYKLLPDKNALHSYYIMDKKFPYSGFSNSTIAEMLCVKFYPYIKDKDSVNISMFFNDEYGDNVIKTWQSKENVKKTVEIFNPTVQHFVEYAFINFDKAGIYALDGRLQFLKQRYVGAFSSHKVFFNLLIDYVIACEKLAELTTEEETQPIVDFFIFMFASKRLQTFAKIGDINKNLLYYYEFFGLKKEWLESEDLSELINNFQIYQKKLYEENKKK